MGIDIYASWDEMTETEKKAQYTGFSVHHGHVGYLREAYHGGPYATRELMPEAFETEADWDTRKGASIPAATLEARLPNVLKTVDKRERTVYLATEEEIQKVQQSFIDFVALIRQLENEGRNPTILASY